MKAYKIIYTKTIVEEYIEGANSVEEAQRKFENSGIDGELFIIEDAEGNQTYFD